MSKKLTLLYPLGEEFTDKKTYLAEKTKEFKKKYKGFKLEERDVSQLLKIAEAGEELADEAEDCHKEILAAFEADIVIARDNLADREREAEAEKNKEATLINYVSEIDFADVSKNFNKKFSFGPDANALIPQGEVSDKELLGALAFAFGSENRSQWMIGDAVVMLEDRGLENVVIQTCAMFKKSYPTVSAYARTARTVPPESRKSAGELPFTVYQEVACAKLEGSPKQVEAKRASILELAVEKQLSAKEVREVVREKQGKKKKDKETKANYVRIVKDKEGLSATLISDEPAFEDDVLVIDIAARKFLGITEEDGKEKVDWIDIPTEE